MAVVQTNIVREFKDLDLNFNIHPVRKDINKHVGNMAVINSIKNLVSLNEGEKFFNPDIGGNIRRLLFENIDEITARNIEKEIQFIIANYEPRVIQPIDQVLVTPNFDQNSFNVRIQFRIQNVSDPLIVSFQLSQTR
jgi:phage baseplate assembly protein W